ncbi:MAG TPA: ABC transporter, partial [Halomonas sp.]|nr:ABC transporter [Halomonas sp.]
IRILRQMADEGVTIIIVLHDMDHLRRLADEVLMLNGGHGRWVAPSALNHQHAPAQMVPFTLGGRHAGTA